MTFKLACVGIGGYAANYINAARRLRDEGQAEIRAVVELYPQRYGDLLEELTSRGTRVYATMEEMFAEHRDIDLVTIGTGLHLHCPMAIMALEHGCHVFLAKPSTTLVQNVDRMTEAARRADRWLAVDFQHIYSEAAGAIKDAIVAGSLGTVEAVVIRLVWCRTERYYRRNNWAGRYRLGDVLVLDGPMNNPHAHYINNAMYFAAPQAGAFAVPVEVQAELYKGHKIEGEDTVSARARTNTGVEILFLATLCGEDNVAHTAMDIIGSAGSARWGFDSYRITTREGTVERPTTKIRGEVALRYVLRCLETGGRPKQIIEDTRGHVLFSNGAYESARAIHPLDERFLRLTGLPENDMSTELVGINALIEEAGERRLLFSEMGAPWARRSCPFDLTGYTSFALVPPQITL